MQQAAGRGARTEEGGAENHMFSSSNQTVTSPAPSRSAPSYNAPYRETPQEREEELKSQREEDRVFIQSITHQLLRVRRTIKRHIEDKDATFVIESSRKGKRTVHFEKTIFPNGRHGSLSAMSGGVTKIAYSLQKTTLSDDQVMKIYLYEDNGQRNLVMTVNAQDINKSGKRNHRSNNYNRKSK